MARLNARWFNFAERGQAWWHFWQDAAAVATAPQPPLITSTVTLFAPTKVILTVKPALIASNVTLFAPREVGIPRPGFISSTVALFAPTKVILTVNPGLIGPTGTLFAPAAAVREQPGVIGPTSVVFGPTTVVLTVKAPAIGSNVALFAPAAATVGHLVLAPCIGAAFDDPNIIFDDPNIQFDGGSRVFAPGVVVGAAAQAVLGATPIHISPAPPRPSARRLELGFIDATAYLWVPQVRVQPNPDQVRRIREDEELLLLL